MLAVILAAKLAVRFCYSDTGRGSVVKGKAIEEVGEKLKMGLGLDS